MPATRTANPAPIPILMYHQIEVAPPRDAPFRSLYVSPQAFCRQMALLKLLGYRGLSMSALAPYLLGEMTGRVVGITFDDGYLNNLINALPTLQAHGFSSTCYAVSQHIGLTNKWDHSVGVRSTPLMNEAQMRKWIEGGQEIGAHTMHHVRLTQADAANSAAEILSCKSQLESATGSPVRHFCYPYGDFTQEHVALVRAAGYESATTTQRSRCQPGEDFTQLPRIPVVRSTSLLHLWLKLATRYEDRRRA
ncbi:MAG: polysaccharide deacetylase family protein [Planctomycetes bacterium]|nr:polysaccharide deacetylase family protein [Planctomycetota bacterium]